MISKLKDRINTMFLSKQVSNYLSLSQKINSNICIKFFSHRFTLVMNLIENSLSESNIIDIRCDGKDNTKEQCSCISIVVFSKKNGWIKWRENSMKDIIEISNAYWRVHLGWGTWSKARKTKFSIKVDF